MSRGGRPSSRRHMPGPAFRSPHQIEVAQIEGHTALVGFTHTNLRHGDERVLPLVLCKHEAMSLVGFFADLAERLSDEEHTDPGEPGEEQPEPEGDDNA